MSSHPLPDPASLDDEMIRLLTRVVTDTSTPAERAAVDAWAAAHPARRTLVDDMGEALRSIPPLPQRYDSAAALERLRARNRPAARPALRLEPRDAEAPPTTVPRVRRGMHVQWRRIAAVIAVLTVPVATYVALDRPEGAGAPVLATTGAGEVRELTLPDGSQVRLGPGSTVRYAELESGERSVTLEGLGRFDVASDSARPFVVHAGSLSARALGTRFVVRAYAHDPLRVMVEEGRVAVRVASTREPLVLTAGRAAEVGGPRSAAALAPAVSTPRDLAWASGVLSFHETPLPEVTRELERWYGARIRVDDGSLRARRVTLSLQRSKLADVLQAVALTLDARVERRSDGAYALIPSEADDTSRDPAR